ncbi:MAG: aminotransferase class V-fold PLP-dependent enzyme [Gemmatimonadota bacterium]|nr:MAG: aminotransferase class V-fold PLP-dependent enzyme [Gemmatimonadota bacterium]
MGVYFDNAATSYPKPERVIEAMRDYFLNVGANSGRSAYHHAQEASRIVFETRECVAQLIGAKDSSRVIFTSNATEGLNMAIMGILNEGDEVVTTSMEHNSVMRPLRYVEQTRSVRIKTVQCSQKGELDPDDVKRNIGLQTKLIVMTSASNVTGTLFPVSEVSRMAREFEIPMLIDAAQTSGCVPLDVTKDVFDVVAFSGHKGLLGPQGTGCLYIREGIDLRPIRYGGTGSHSEFEFQPDFLPDRYESGTLNVIGIAGLGAAVNYLLEKGVENVRAGEEQLMESLLDTISHMEDVTVYGTGDSRYRTGVLSITIDGMEPSEVGYELDAHYDIALRVGLHCSPAAHKTIGTFPEGTIRISLGPFNTEDDINLLCNALDEITVRK